MALPRHRYLLIELQALDPSLLPPENVLSMIARLEQARSPEQFEEFLDSLAEWLERAGEPDAVLECETAEECTVRAREAAGMS